MKRVLALVALLALAAFGGEGTPLPFNPWDGAKEGDWETLVVDVKNEGVPDVIKQKLQFLELVTYRVRGADEKEVKLGFETIPTLVDEAVSVVYSRSETPTFESLLDVKGKVRDLKFTSEDHTVGGKVFSCTKATYTAISSLSQKAENVVWFAKDVKAFRVVEMVTIVPAGKDARYVITYRVAGFGTKDKTDWGKTPAELKPKK